jgi:GMP synthase (glutamine-hydrolysing)
MRLVLLAKSVLAALICLALTVGFAAHADAGKDQWLLVVMTPGGELNGYKKLKRTVQSIKPKMECLSVPYRSITIDLVERIDPAFIILGPQGMPWCKYTGRIGVHLQSFLWILPYVAEELNIPILGICGGHQALAMAFGGKVGPIRAESGDCLPYTSERQLGLIGLTRLKDDLIFAGVGPRIYVKQSHYDEVKVLPGEFVLLAREEASPNQIMRHAYHPVYGIQGHPELADSVSNHGAVLIRNFLASAANHNKIHAKRAKDYRGVSPSRPFSSSQLW